MNNSNKNESQQVLLVSPQDETSANTIFLLQLAGYEVSTARGLDEAVNLVSSFCLERDFPAVILIDDQKIVANRDEMIQLLATRCQNSKIFIVERNVQTDNHNVNRDRFIAPRHILAGIKQFITEQDSENENFDSLQGFHSPKLKAAAIRT